MKKSYLVAAFIISIALGFTMWAFSSGMSRYVDIKAARASETPVQLKGRILRNVPGVADPKYDERLKALRFTVEDDNKERIMVVYYGGKPDAFDTAPETAARGLVRNGEFVSDSLIVKCPSKYDDKRTPNLKTVSNGGTL